MSKRVPVVYPTHGGKKCTDEEGNLYANFIGSQTEKCTKNDIKVSCKGKDKVALGPWTEWSDCITKQCDSKMYMSLPPQIKIDTLKYGYKYRIRTCHYQDECGHAKLEEQKKCPERCDYPTSMYKWYSKYT